MLRDERGNGFYQAHYRSSDGTTQDCVFKSRHRAGSFKNRVDFYDALACNIGRNEAQYCGLRDVMALPESANGDIDAFGRRLF